MLEEIAEFKKLASIKSLVQNGTDVKIWAYSQNVMELIIVGKQGNTPKKMTLSRHYDIFKGEPYKFLDDYILELYKKPEIKERLDSSAFFQSKGFTFSDFPGVDKVKKLLDSTEL